MRARKADSINRPGNSLDRKAGNGSRRALIVHPRLEAKGGNERSPEARLAEATGLVAAIGLEIAGAEIAPLRRVHPRTLFGMGAIERLSAAIEEQRIDVVVVDSALSAVQQRNLERAWRAKVIDRTGLILEIFGERARTREGRLQVELAHLTYQRSRLVRSWTHLERQRGGFGFLGGPGETQIESDRRQIDQRVTQIRRDLSTVTRTRGLHREARRRVPYPIIALVGYTNAGKSTLFNRLTGARVDARDMLFATLDPTMRRLRLPSGRAVILSDTVGFVSDLPTDLVAAFRATLEEVREADIILHVRDISHADEAAQRRDVLRILEQLGIDEERRDRVIEVWNKTDRLDEPARRRTANLACRNGNAVPLSARRGEGCEALLDMLERRLSEGREVINYAVPLEDGASIAWLYEHGNVVRRRDEDGIAQLRVELDREQIARFRHRSPTRTR
jgi:GTP-binding protein HflX